MKSKWPLKYRIWRSLHVVVNNLAWKYGPIEDGVLKLDHWIWRLNKWVAYHYTDWYVYDRRLRNAKAAIGSVEASGLTVSDELKHDLHLYAKGVLTLKQIHAKVLSKIKNK